MDYNPWCHKKPDTIEHAHVDTQTHTPTHTREEAIKR